MGDPGTTAPPAPRRERVFTPALVVFLVLVFSFDAVAWWRRDALPSLGDAIVELADGDLDRPERERYLAYLSELGPASASIREQWAGMLAAVALGDRPRFEQALQVLGGPPVPTRFPALPEAEFLDLGEPLLGNLAAALRAEGDGDRQLARTRWSQVQNQARLCGLALPKELAGAALARLP
ncbi:MAG: hypothetical protein K8J09_03485 [Planctomycetes bacterium]|nr:hypothetical protein [Planctomycetota bacterium]MCC7398091.1 hypothetical protein [Planctomycetota bacterium]